MILYHIYYDEIDAFLLFFLKKKQANRHMKFSELFGAWVYLFRSQINTPQIPLIINYNFFYNILE